MSAPTRPITPPELTGDGEPPAGGERLPPELMERLRELLGGADAPRLLDRRPLGAGVERQRVAAGERVHALIVKASDPWMARRNRLVAERWLPALGMAAHVPPLLGCAAERGGERVWQIAEDLGDCILDEAAPDRERVAAAVDVIARLHTRAAEHVLLAECRLWGTDYGTPFLASGVRDALRALARLRAPELALDARQASLRDRLRGRLTVLRDQLPARGGLLARHGGPETLLHGDLWPKNVLVRRAGDGAEVRLIDWDRVGVGSFVHDVSAFLSRFPAAERRWILDRYRRAVARAGWTLPGEAELNALGAGAELARLTSRVVWPAIAIAEGHPARDWAFAELDALAGWLDDARPLLAP